MIAWNISYGGLYELGYFLQNPFGSRRVDVAHEIIGDGINNLSKNLAAGRCVPNTMSTAV